MTPMLRFPEQLTAGKADVLMNKRMHNKHFICEVCPNLTIKSATGGLIIVYSRNMYGTTIVAFMQYNCL